MQIRDSRKTLMRVGLRLSSDGFIAQWNQIFESITGKKFVIDQHNKSVIEQMYYYLTMNKKYKGDLNKGILMIGNYGTGKTIIMMIIKYLIEINTDRRLTFINCSNMYEETKDRGITYFYKRPIILDEIGRETQVIKDYGTERRPMIELLSQRYNNRAWTFGTSNMNQSEIAEFYGGYIFDRFIEMFNIIKLDGNSRRK